MMYQAVATIKSTEQGLRSYMTGWWETSELAQMELQGLMYRKMPNGAFQMTTKVITNKTLFPYD